MLRGSIFYDLPLIAVKQNRRFFPPFAAPIRKQRLREHFSFVPLGPPTMITG